MHYLYFFGKLPGKNQYKELTPEYYKQKRNNNMIFEEINFLARNSFKSISEVENYMNNLEKQLPELKGRRELLWKKYKSANENDKANIVKEIHAITDKIDTFHAQMRACNRIIEGYKEIKEDYNKEIESKEVLQEIIVSDRKKRIRFR